MDFSLPDDDPLGVLTTTRHVVLGARHVRIEPEAVAALAETLADRTPEPPSWQDSLHYSDGTWRTAGWVLALDALNYCFWSPHQDDGCRWRVRYEGVTYDGYWALVAALRRAVDEGIALWEPDVLSALSDDDVAHLLRPNGPSSEEIPLLPTRAAHLRELGRGLQAFASTHAELEAETPLVARFIRHAQGSAVGLTELVRLWFPSFDDRADYRGIEVHFLKRAQILAADLGAAFDHRGLGAFHDLHHLTAFADYKVPQMLRHLGILTYDPDLAAIVDSRTPLEAGSDQEIEIRAATIWACELIRRAASARGVERSAVEIDWMLWEAGQAGDTEMRPYHRTVTVFY